MLVINIFGGPGSGKSTLAADVYAKLKRLHINIELAREFAKEKVWEKSLHVLKDQVHILGEQHHRQFILSDQCDVAITDSPILLCCIYNTFYTEYDKFDALALEAHNRYDNLNYVLTRSHEFQELGRVEDKQKSIEIDEMITSFLKKNNVRYKEVSNPEATDILVQDVLDSLQEEKI
jgi:nicotinamide riboside kinase